MNQQVPDENEGNTPEPFVAVPILRLRANAQGLAVGLIAAVTLFVATNVLVLKGGIAVGKHLGLLGNYFPGYTVSFVGSLVGAVYSFVTGYLFGYIIAVAYNWVADARAPK